MATHPSTVPQLGMQHSQTREDLVICLPTHSTRSCRPSAGIVFIDEIDKIVTSSEHRYGGDASAEGVQRDLLPIIEGAGAGSVV